MTDTVERTRFWSSDEGSSTCIQFRTDRRPAVWIHTNIGWIPVGNTPPALEQAEHFAENIAMGYNLTERDEAHARFMAGWDESLEA